MHAVAFVISMILLFMSVVFMFTFVFTFMRVAQYVRVRLFRGFVTTAFIGVLLLLYSGVIKF